MNVSEFLAHHGVKGQKWGVRKQRSQKETKIRAKRKKVAQNRRSLSDQDLKKYIERLSEEKKLKELVNQDLSPGSSAVKKIMTDSGQKVARTVVAGAGLYAIKSLLERKFSAKEAAGYITPKPKNK